MIQINILVFNQYQWRSSIDQPTGVFNVPYNLIEIPSMHIAHFDKDSKKEYRKDAENSLKSECSTWT